MARPFNDALLMGHIEALELAVAKLHQTAQDKAITHKVANDLAEFVQKHEPAISLAALERLNKLKEVYCAKHG